LQQRETSTPGNEGPARDDALRRAREHAPFLRDALSLFPDISERFATSGARAAIESALGVQAESVDSELRLRRHRLALAVALGDLAGELGLEDVTEVLSSFADEAIDRAVAAALAERNPGEEPRGIAAIALGKLGSRELNYSSDVDLLLLFDPASIPRRERDEPGEAAVRIGRRIVEIIQKRTADGYVARVDLRLRPSPEVTPIILPANAAISYYESAALGWERAAFIRARACAGDRALGEKFLEAIKPFVWRRALDFGALDEIGAMTKAVRDHYAQGQRFGPGFDVKRGRGGIREIEFFAQAHQLIHGGRNADLRCGATMDALEALAFAGHVSREQAQALSDSYRRLRTAEHRLQMVADQQTHVLPADETALDGVARLHGLGGGGQLLEWLEPAVSRAATAFDQLAQDDGERLPTGKEALAHRLRDLGYDDAEQAMRRIAEWRSGRPRSLRSAPARAAFEAMLPELLAAIATGRDPGHALNRLSDIVERLSSGINLYRLLQARPDLTRLLARILAHAPALSDQLARRPQLIDGLLDASSFDSPPPAARVAQALADSTSGQPYDVAIDLIRRMVNERRFALGVQLIDLREDPLEVGRGYARVAEGALVALADRAIAEFEAAHGRIAGGELVVVGLGRLGGQVLTHASDLDLIYLHTPVTPGARSDGPKPLGPSDYFNRLATRVTAALGVPTAAGPLYEVDTRLRPEGAHGMLAVSLDAFAAYQRNEAWTWEHMALTRARPVFGSAQAQAATEAVIDSILGLERDSQKVIAEAAKMRADMARHKPPSGPLDVKLGEGGLVDLEFAVHVLQLTHRTAFEARLEEAVEQLFEAGLIPENIAENQKLLTRMLVALRLVAPDGNPPAPETCELVARACGAAGWDELLARHDAARQSIAELWQSLKGTSE
jgi:glutamate-ammonia-ligase adenylyltransferase